MEIFTEKSSKRLVWIGVILIIIGGVSFLIGERFFDFNSEIKSDKIGQLGDFFGGVIGSIWALAGVILFYVAFNKQVDALEDQKRSTEAAIKSLEIQSTELKLQRDELKETRKEFLINRITNIIYHQLSRFEKSLEEFEILAPNGQKLKGNEAFSFLDKKLQNLASKESLSTPRSKKEFKEELIKKLKILTPNKSNIETFANNAWNSVKVIQRLTYTTNLNIEDLNEIKALFFLNIGFVKMSIIEKLIRITEEESFREITAQDYIDNNIDSMQLIVAEISLESIKEFYELSLTKENFDEEKKKWKKNKGFL